MADPLLSTLAAGSSTTAITAVGFTAQPSGTLLLLSVSADDYRATTGTDRPESSGWTLAQSGEDFLGAYLWWKVADGTEASVSYKIGSAAASSHVVVAASNIDPTPLGGGSSLHDHGVTTVTTTAITPAAGSRWLVIASLNGMNNTGTRFTGMGALASGYTTQVVRLQGAAPDESIALGYLTLDGGTATSTSGAWQGQSSQCSFGMLQAFKVATGGGSTNVTLTGAVSGITIASPAGSVSLVSNVTITGELAGITVSALAGSVSTSSGVDVALTGEVSGITVASPPGTANASSNTDNISLTGAVVSLTVDSLAGAVELSTTINDAGAPAGLTIASPAGSVSVSTVVNISLTGQVSGVSIAAPGGTLTLSSVGDVSLVGQASGIATAAPVGSLNIVSNVALTGQAVGITTAALGGSLNTGSNASFTGQSAGIAIAAPAGSVAGLSIDIQLTGEVVGVSIDSPVGSITVGTTLYFFTPPVYRTPFGTREQGQLMARLWYDVGISVVKKNGSYTQYRYVDSDVIDAADVTYLGGHVYEISQDEYNDLLTAGYEANLSTELVSA